MRSNGKSSIPNINNKGTRRSQNNRRLTSVSHFAPELKAVDTAISLNADTSGAIQLLNGVAPGTALNERIGRRIMMTNLKYRLQSTVTAGTGVDQIHRLMIVRDKQPNGAALAINNVIDGGSTSQLNLSYQDRFVILLDKRVYLNASGEPGSGIVLEGTLGVSAQVQFNNGVAGTVADIATNSLYLIVLGTVAAGATAGVLAGSIRLRYYDE